MIRGRLGWLRLAIVLAVIADVLALGVLLRGTPYAITTFMFLGPPLFLVGFLVLAGAILADLRSRGLL
jgi:hypothetical protein